MVTQRTLLMVRLKEVLDEARSITIQLDDIPTCIGTTLARGSKARIPCGVELTKDNWYPTNIARNVRICKDCNKRYWSRVTRK